MEESKDDDEELRVQIRFQEEHDLKTTLDAIQTKIDAINPFVHFQQTVR